SSTSGRNTGFDFARGGRCERFEKRSSMNRTKTSARSLAARQSRPLRARAEHWLRQTPRQLSAMSNGDMQDLVHELQVYQVELEMQNEELRRTQIELESSRNRFAEL